MSEKDEKTAEAPEAAVHCFCLGMGPKVTAMMQTKSESAREHFRTARVEMLKGIRTLIDERIEYLSRTPKKGTTVPIE